MIILRGRVEMELSDVRITSIHEMRDWPVGNMRRAHTHNRTSAAALGGGSG